MATLKQAVEHTRTTRVFLTANEVLEILARTACDLATVDFGKTVVDVELTQQKEGSPSYLVSSWTAVVKIVEYDEGHRGELPSVQATL